MDMIKRVILAVLALGVIVGGASRARASFMIDTNQSDFVSRMSPGYFFNDFSSLPNPPQVSPLMFSGNGFAYTATESSGAFESQALGSGHVAVSTNAETDTMTLTFTSGNVTGVGGNFWLTALDFSTIPGTVSVSAFDGTNTSSFDVVNGDPSTFVGFLSTVPIVSLTITPPSPDSGQYATMSNVDSGTGNLVPTPEPSAVVLAGFGALALIGYGYRTHRR
jgi:hypothetical protein